MTGLPLSLTGGRISPLELETNGVRSISCFRFLPLALGELPLELRLIPLELRLIPLELRPIPLELWPLDNLLRTAMRWPMKESLSEENPSSSGVTGIVFLRIGNPFIGPSSGPG